MIFEVATRIGNRLTAMDVKNTAKINGAGKMGIITAPVGKKNGAGWKLMRTAKEERRWFVLNADAHLQVNCIYERH